MPKSLSEIKGVLGASLLGSEHSFRKGLLANGLIVAAVAPWREAFLAFFPP
jgi:hypothetical protein